MATLIKTTINWGWLKGSEVQSITIKAQEGMEQEELEFKIIIERKIGED